MTQLGVNGIMIMSARSSTNLSQSPAQTGRAIKVLRSATNLQSDLIGQLSSRFSGRSGSRVKSAYVSPLAITAKKISLGSSARSRY